MIENFWNVQNFVLYFVLYRTITQNNHQESQMNFDVKLRFKFWNYEVFQKKKKRSTKLTKKNE